MPGPGILSTILDTTGERLRERLKMDQDFRSMQTKSLVDAIHAIDENGNPKLSPEQMDQAWEEIASLNKSKTAKDVIAKARDIVGKIHGMGNKPNPALLQPTD